MGWPQITWIVLAAIGVGIHVAKHGEPHKGKRTAWPVLIRVAFCAWLLSAGGFFGPPAHAQVPSDAVRYRSLLIRVAQAEWGLNAPVALFAAQVHQESAWNPEAVSRVGAAGLAQFMPATSRWIATQRPGLVDPQPYNPAWALQALVAYDRWLYERTPARYGAHDRMWVALRGYNGGLGHWQAEAVSSGLVRPTRAQVDAACGKARRAAVHCKENLGYPHRILLVLQPRYAAWGPGL